MQVIEKGWNGSNVVVAVSFFVNRYRPPQSFIFIEQAEKMDSTFIQNPSFSSTRVRRPITKRLVGKKINCIFLFTKEETEPLKSITLSIIIGKIKEDTLTIDMTDILKISESETILSESERTKQEEDVSSIDSVIPKEEVIQETQVVTQPVAKQKQSKNSPKPIKRIEE